MRWITLFAALATIAAAHANPCETQAHATERALDLPPDLLLAIGRIETGRRDESGRVVPWPWSVNAAGEGHFLASASEAIDLVHSLQAQGIRSIDVGCFQVNLLHHPTAFQTLADAFDPPSNARAAGQFLSSLRTSARSWEQAVADYHSANPTLGMPYLRQVMLTWRGGATMPQAPISQVAASVRVFVPQAFAPAKVTSGASSATQPFGPRLPVVIVPGLSHL